MEDEIIKKSILKMISNKINNNKKIQRPNITD